VFSCGCRDLCCSPEHLSEVCCPVAGECFPVARMAAKSFARSGWRRASIAINLPAPWAATVRADPAKTSGFSGSLDYLIGRDGRSTPHGAGTTTGRGSSRSRSGESFSKAMLRIAGGEQGRAARAPALAVGPDNSVWRGPSAKKMAPTSGSPNQTMAAGRSSNRHRQ